MSKSVIRNAGKIISVDVMIHDADFWWLEVFSIVPSTIHFGLIYRYRYVYELTKG